MRPDEQRQAEPGHARRAHRVHRHEKLSPVRIEEKPVMNTPTTAGATAEFEYTVLSGV